MKITFQPKTVQRLLLALLTTVLFATATFAQSDEETIRNLAKLENEGTPIKLTDNVVVWAGISDQPIVGKQNWEAKRKEFGKARPNTKFNRVPERIVISESKDLAYEYGAHASSWDKPEGGRAENAGYYMRVWRKVNGEWLQEAFFIRLTE